MSWETVIGLEVHVQLATRSKLFCACSPAFGDSPNHNVCPVCLGLPGALPALNEGAVRLAVRAALALGCTVHDTSVFARKHYFYPDLPKGYQISQFDRPLATAGGIAIGRPGRARFIGIARLHVEEDAGKLLHDRFPDATAIDFNRCGAPLIEIVSEPALRSPAEAREFLGLLKQILEYLEVSDCNMEEGSLRVDANLSVRRPGQPLGVKQEVKNMNSFAAVTRALEQLDGRQREQAGRGAPIELTTFSAATGELRAMREKEESDDYRYFPEPDLAPLVLSRVGIDVVEERARLPELPQAKRERLREQYGLPEHAADVLSGSREVADHFEAVAGEGADPRLAANWILGPVLEDRKAHGAFRVMPPRLADLLRMVDDGMVSRQAAKQVYRAMADADTEARPTAERLGLFQVSDTGQLSSWVEAVIAEHPTEVARYRGGERRLMGFFVGQVMKQSAGAADPKRVQSVIRERIG